jgi:hypothetical protein
MVKESENVRVVVRVRPLTEREERKGDEELVSCVGDRSVQVVDPSQARGRTMTGTAYQFNQCFGAECTQEQLFEGCGVLPLLDHVLEGYSATVFAYGPTGSGKTYTITGRPDNILKYGSGDGSDGIVIRSVEALFDKISQEQRDGLQFKVRASCVEIYNENVLDLFKFKSSKDGKNYLPVKFDTNRGSFFVGDLSYGKCNTVEELLRLYMKALRNRSVASHELNRDSSRSHCLLTVYVDSMVAAENGHISTRHGKISFVDLAGSERLKDSQSQGSTLRETGAINKSIFTLGKVISSLCDRKKTKIPYRDSKLTQLLMDSIGGTSMTIMLACVSPASSHVNESIRTLNYASSAKNIKNKPVVLLDPQQTMVSELKKEIEQLRAENKALRDALLGQSQQGPFPFQNVDSRSSSAPDNALADKSAYPSQNLRHSTGGLKQQDYPHNRPADIVLSFPSPKDKGERGRMSGAPNTLPDHRSNGFNGRSVEGGERARNFNHMPSVRQKPSPDKSKGQSNEYKGSGCGEYGKVRPHDPLAHRRAELQPAHFQMPQIHVSGRSAQEIQQDERSLMRDLDSAASFSYFKQHTSESTSPTSYHSVIRSSGNLAQDERDKALARQRMKTAERHLREEILQLPEAQEYFPHHQRRVLQPGERPRSKSAMDGGDGRGAGEQKKKHKSPVSERAGLRELEKLSRYSYFTDESFSAGTRPSVPGSKSTSPGKGHIAQRQNGDPHAVGHRASDGHRYQQGGAAMANGDVRAGATSAPLYTQKPEEMPSYGQQHYGFAHLGGGASSSFADRKLRDNRDTSPKSIRERPQAGSPKSIRSSAADGIYIGSSSGHRPSSADRERLLDDAYNDLLGGGGGRGGLAANGSNASRNLSGMADEDWMTKLNPLAGLDLENAAAGNWQQELQRAASKGAGAGAGGHGKENHLHHNGSREPGFNNVAPRCDRPRSANRPPSVPRNYPQQTSQASREVDVKHGGQAASSARALDSGLPFNAAQVRVHQAGAGGDGRSPSKDVGGGRGGGGDSGGSSYEELMRNLEQSRLKAQQARNSILEKRQQWQNQIDP